MLTSGSLGTMGVCVPYAIGAKLSNPHDIVICIDGDGSFCMTCSDLQTVAELNIPIKICIMNDGKQQMVKIWQKLFFNGRYVATDNKNPDFVKLGESYGIKSIKCDTVHKLKSITEEMLKYNDGPILVEYKVTPDICLPLVSPGKSLSDMIINVEDIDTDEMSKKKHHIPS
jgi:acetolactate synthase-1/2/3 large subunit